MNALRSPRRPGPRSLVVAAVWVGCWLAAGCSGEPVPESAADDRPAHLVQLAQAYREATRALGRPPETQEEFLAYAREHPARGSAAAPEDWLKSPVDGLPYTVVWGANADEEQRASPTPVVLAYEQHGENGRRWVLTALGVQRLSADEFKRARFPRGHLPPS